MKSQPLYIRFNSDGIVTMFSEQKKPCHILTSEIPKDFRVNPDYYQICIKDGDIYGLELREDLEEYKKKQQELQIEDEFLII